MSNIEIPSVHTRECLIRRMAKYRTAQTNLLSTFVQMSGGSSAVIKFGPEFVERGFGLLEEKENAAGCTCSPSDIMAHLREVTSKPSTVGLEQFHPITNVPVPLSAQDPFNLFNKAVSMAYLKRKHDDQQDDTTICRTLTEDLNRIAQGWNALKIESDLGDELGITLDEFEGNLVAFLSAVTLVSNMTEKQKTAWQAELGSGNAEVITAQNSFTTAFTEWEEFQGVRRGN